MGDRPDRLAGRSDFRHIQIVSIAEIQSELKKLSPAELAVVETLMQQIKTEQSFPIPPVTMEKFMGCTQGMMTLHSGWDEPEPPEIWDAMRDDASL